MTIKHLFVNPKSDGADATITRPSDWNADHVIDGSVILPQGRLTLQSGVPVQTSDQTAKTTVYYDSFLGSLVPVWNGTYWTQLAIASDEISMGLAAANVLNGIVYDVWGCNVSGALAIGVGPPWTSTTARGTGAGTTAGLP